MSDKPKILCTSFPYWLGSIDVNLEKGLLAYTSGWARIQISKFDDSGIENLKEVEAYGSTYQSIALSLGGTRLAATTDDGRLIFWRLEEGEEKTERQVSDYHTGSVVFSPDGRFLAVGDSGGFLYIVYADTLRVLDRAEISSRAILALVFASDARTVYASGEEENVLVCKIKEDTAGMVRIEKESVMRRTNCYAGMKIRKNDLPRIRLYSLEGQGAVIEEGK